MRSCRERNAYSLNQRDIKRDGKESVGGIADEFKKIWFNVVVHTVA
jgi:hypothetical protein